MRKSLGGDCTSTGSTKGRRCFPEHELRQWDLLHNLNRGGTGPSKTKLPSLKPRPSQEFSLPYPRFRSVPMETVEVSEGAETRL